MKIVGYPATLDSKGGPMKNLRPILFALTVLLTAAAAQAQEAKVRAIVPFNFVVGDRAYPAGEYYLISLDNSNGVVRIDSTQEGSAAMVVSNSCSTTKPSEKTKLVFHRMGGSYFLYQIWTEGHFSGREFRRSSTEIKMAQNHLKPEDVIVAANLSR
jgi:hypothetical protein